MKLEPCTTIRLFYNKVLLGNFSSKADAVAAMKQHVQVNGVKGFDYEFIRSNL